ncbi:unnamed protein product [Prunus armeniaca]|uniref:Uncharacterized protein n=1 Tax=Prunus armeniaca TaxID=36596 RepID=A0A6J5X766_PRUAR|nr:unnamed protein product [Prunus armeniaca]CAB4309649.1 unnamed protein product [Prunus armeniaca]
MIRTLEEERDRAIDSLKTLEQLSIASINDIDYEVQQNKKVSKGDEGSSTYSSTSWP